eukprot:3345321-Amphidinium_carterae.1
MYSVVVECGDVELAPSSLSGRTISAEAVQGNFSPLFMNGKDVFRFATTKVPQVGGLRSAAKHAYVVWPASHQEAS